MAGLVLATWSLERRRRQIDESIAKIYKINYKNRYFPIWDYASTEVIFAPAETSAVALGRRTCYRISRGGNRIFPEPLPARGHRRRLGLLPHCRVLVVGVAPHPPVPPTPHAAGPNLPFSAHVVKPP